MPAFFMSGWKLPPLPPEAAAVAAAAAPAAEQAAELAVEVAPQLVEVRRALVGALACGPGAAVGRCGLRRLGLAGVRPACRRRPGPSADRSG